MGVHKQGFPFYKKMDPFILFFLISLLLHGLLIISFGRTFFLLQKSPKELVVFDLQADSKTVLEPLLPKVVQAPQIQESNDLSDETPETTPLCTETATPHAVDQDISPEKNIESQPTETKTESSNTSLPKPSLNPELLKKMALARLLKPTQEPKESKKTTSPLTISTLVSGDEISTHGNTTDDLNLADMKYYSYLKRILLTIGKEAQRNLAPIPRSTSQETFFLRIDSLGKIIHLAALDPKITTQLTDKLSKLVQNSGPFRPIPKHLNRSELTLTISFRLESSGFTIGLNVV